MGATHPAESPRMADHADLTRTSGPVPPPVDPTRTSDPAATADGPFTHSAGDSPPALNGLPDIPGYDLLGELGRGGMGVVYQARQLALNRLVALKLLSDGPAASAARLVRFRQEAEAVARLQHPNIVQVFEVGAAAGGSFLVMEYVDGETLAEKTAGVPQPPRDAARLVETVARRVATASGNCRPGGNPEVRAGFFLDDRVMPSLPLRKSVRKRATVTRNRFRQIVGCVLAGVLLAAAGLKLHALTAPHPILPGWYSSPMVQLLAAQWEIGLALWLVSGWFRTGAWLASLFTFMGFACLALLLALSGSRSCGCLGQVRANPWYMVVADALAVAVLLGVRPTWDELKSSFASVTAASARWKVIGPVGAAVLVSILLYQYPRLRQQVAFHVTGTDVFFANGTSEIRLILPASGEALTGVVTLRNEALHPVRIVGGYTDGQCLNTLDLPCVIEGGSEATIRVKCQYPCGAQTVEKVTCYWWTDNRRQPLIRATIVLQPERVE